MKASPMPPLEDLQEFYVIDSASPSGITRIKPARGRNARVGPVISIGSDGYYRMKFRGVHYRCHRVIYFMAKESDPGELVVDHIDGDRLNNKVENLRACTQAQNMCNTKARQSKKGLPKGVRKLSEKVYQAQLSINGEVHTSVFENIRAAINYSKCLRARYHGEFARP